MPSPMRRLLCRLGFRGCVLLVMGAIWALIGVVNHLTPETPPDPEQIVGLFHAQIPQWWLVWVTAGLVSVAAGFLRRARRDVWGFVALIIPPGLQAMSYGWAALVWLVSGGGLGFGLGVMLAIGWGLIALLPHILSGWAEPARNGDGQ